MGNVALLNCVRVIALPIIIGLCSVALAGDGKTPFMDEVRDRFHAAKMIQLNLSDLIAQYVPVGTTKEQMFRFCENNGLKASYVTHKKRTDSHEEAYVCMARVKLSRNSKGEPIGFGQEINAYFKLTGGKVIAVSGAIYSLQL